MGGKKQNVCLWVLFWTNSSFPAADEDAEEEELDEEARLMASMGLPLAFASASDHRRAVSPQRSTNAKKTIPLLHASKMIVFLSAETRRDGVSHTALVGW